MAVLLDESQISKLCRINDMSTYYNLTRGEINLNDIALRQLNCGFAVYDRDHKQRNFFGNEINSLSLDGQNFYISMLCDICYYGGIPMSVSEVKSSEIYNEIKDDLIFETKMQKLWIDCDEIGKVIGFVRYGDNIVDGILSKIQQAFDVEVRREE